jgi:hypothetical protein
MKGKDVTWFRAWANAFRPGNAIRYVAYFVDRQKTVRITVASAVK